MSSFAYSIRHARRILVSQTNGLGDVIHSLPAIHAIAASCPHATIDLLAGHHAASVAEMVPAIAGTVIMDGYPRPKSRFRRYLMRIGIAWRIARNRYDAVIELSPKDRSVAFLAFSGAGKKLAVNFNSEMRLGWFYSQVATEEWTGEPFHQYVCHALQAKGFNAPYWTLQACPLDLSAIEPVLETPRPYIHLSLFGTEAARQFPIDEAGRLIAGLLQELPSYQLVITCSSAPREVDELSRILSGGLASKVRVFAGSLSVPRLTKLIQGAALHIGPDTGSLHLAVLTGCPTVSWFLNKSSFMTWAPRGSQHRILLSVGEQNPTGKRMCGVKAQDVTEAAKAALGMSVAANRQESIAMPNIQYFLESYCKGQKAPMPLKDDLPMPLVGAQPVENLGDPIRVAIPAYGRG